MSEELYGTDNLRRVIDLIVELGNVMPKVIKSESLIGKVTAFAAVTDELIALARLKPSMIKPEWKDFSDSEKAEMVSHIKEKFEIEDDKIEMMVEEALVVAIEQLEIGGRIIDLARKYKKKLTPPEAPKAE
jgi:hypothetical protein